MEEEKTMKNVPAGCMRAGSRFPFPFAVIFSSFSVAYFYFYFSATHNKRLCLACLKHTIVGELRIHWMPFRINSEYFRFLLLFINHFCLFAQTTNSPRIAKTNAQLQRATTIKMSIQQQQLSKKKVNANNNNGNKRNQCCVRNARSSNSSDFAEFKSTKSTHTHFIRTKSHLVTTC